MGLVAAFFKRQLFSEPPIPNVSFKGRTVIVTGGNTGLGLEAVRSIVRLGASQVILACRSIAKGEAAMEDIRSSTSCSANALQVWQLDMCSNASILRFAERVNSLPRLDAFLANAGMTTMNFRLAEGNEEVLTTNVISTTLLLCLAFPKLHESALKFNINTQITITGSELYEVAKFKEADVPVGQIFASLNDKSKAQMMDRYNVTKLLLLYVLKEIAEISPISNKVIVNVIAPGFCKSSLGQQDAPKALLIAGKLFTKAFARSAEVGARTLVYGASAGPETHGQYLPDCKITPTEALAKGEKGAELQRRVWAELREKLEAIKPEVTSLGFK